MEPKPPSWRDRHPVLAAPVEYIRGLFSLEADTDYENTLAQVRAASEFKGGNLWALVFAIALASVGLNVNSTAVIIGAMLISPLMGPIMGIGIALAVNDVTQLRRSARHLAVAVGVSIAVSALYFAISPLAEAQSELLARTRPTLYDVLIAVFGGSAGIVAVSRRGDKGNVIPGVAIATALMPPLCTAGYGLASLNLAYFAGALYLFLINTLFICLATYFFARQQKFMVLAHLDDMLTARIRRMIAVATICAIVPSVWVAYNVVQESRFEAAARRFVAENLAFPDRDIVNVNLRYRSSGSLIGATVLGQPLDEEMKRTLQDRLDEYGLTETTLEFRQPTANQVGAEELTRMVRQGILEDLYRRNEQALAEKDDRIRLLEDEIVRLQTTRVPLEILALELAALFPDLRGLGAGRRFEMADSTGESTLIVASWARSPTAAVTSRLEEFLLVRLGTEDVHLVNEVVR